MGLTVNDMQSGNRQQEAEAPERFHAKARQQAGASDHFDLGTEAERMTREAAACSQISTVQPKPCLSPVDFNTTKTLRS